MSKENYSPCMTQQYRHRQLILISDTTSDCLQIANHLTANTKTLWLSDFTIEGQNVLAVNKATTVLGQEFQAVVFNAHQKDNNNIAFDANAFAAIIGTLIGGGYLILLTPDLKQWTDNSRFLQRFIRLLKQFNIHFYNKNKPSIPAIKLASPLPTQHKELNNEQQTVFNVMLRVMQGHRRRPLVLTSDRGRGKSTLLGKLAAHLLKQNISPIIITAPSRKIANTLFNAATIALQNNKNAETLLQGLHFLSPDQLHQQKPQAHLVLVDEAASIPLSMLRSFVKQHSRLIFATTEHGYEGSGRGFAIRFRHVLNETCPQWKSIRLEHPFRWAADDPLEKFSFDALLLNAKIATIAPSSHLTSMTFSKFYNTRDALTLPQQAYYEAKASAPKCHIEVIKQDELLKNESLLTEIFGLFVSAHYQTRPSDLVRLLDDPQYQIFIMRYEKQLIASALMVREGGFKQGLATKIYHGKRRLQGHLVPQLLATHTGIKDAPCYICDRIMRLAVHPELQGIGLGSHLLQYLIRYSKQQKKVDYIATSFGATPTLIAFWSKAGFKTVQISMKRDASSGTHSIIMLTPLKNKARCLYRMARDNFKQALPLLLADPLCHLETPLVTALFKPSLPQIKPTKRLLSEMENHAVYAFCDQQRGYESSIVAIYKLTLYALFQPNQLNNLTADEVHLLIAKVLQKHSWQSLVTQTGVTGRKQAIKLLRRAVKKLVYPY
jgi:tRNA(Met) cytidine acetyltransferase